MARTTIATQEISFLGAAAITMTAADTANGMRARIKDKKTRIVIDNADASPHTVTVNSVSAGPLGRTGDLTIVVPAGEARTLYQLPQEGFQQNSGVDSGFVTFDIEDDTSVTIGVYEDA